MKGRLVGPFLALLGGALFGGAFYAYVQQLTVGLAVTGLNRPAAWGLYIANFDFFNGLSAGGIIIASLVYAFGLRQFRSVARIAVLMAISCIILAAIFIFLDLGRPDRLFFLFRHGRPWSPLIWDVIVINLYLLIILTYAYFGMRADLARMAEAVPGHRWLYRFLTLGYTDLSPQALARGQKLLRVLAVIGLVMALVLHSVSAWILGLVKARPGWHSAIIAPLFIVSATVSGLALLLVSIVFCRRVLRFPIEEKVIKDLGKLLAFSIPILGYFLFAELLTVTYAKEPPVLSVFKEMMYGLCLPLLGKPALWPSLPAGGPGSDPVGAPAEGRPVGRAPGCTGHRHRRDRVPGESPGPPWRLGSGLAGVSPPLVAGARLSVAFPG